MIRNVAPLFILGAACLAFHVNSPANAAEEVERFDVYEATFQSQGRYSNPYTDLEANVYLKGPDGAELTIPLFLVLSAPHQLPA